MITVSVTLNGRPRQFAVSPGDVLADILRDACGLTGCKVGCDQGVCGEHSGAAGVRENHQPGAAGPRLTRQSFRHVEQICDALHAQDAATAKSRVENFIAAR